MNLDKESGMETPELICYFNGNFMKESAVKIPLRERALWNGYGAHEVSRTYNHIPRFWEEHIDRLYRGLHYIHIALDLTQHEMLNITHEVFKHNEKYLDPEDDFIVAHLVAKGASPHILGGPTQPYPLIICDYLSPRYEYMAKNYREGIHLVVANTRQVPPQCFDVKVKHISRLANWLADYEAKMIDPEALALMLDINGLVAEGTASNCFMVKNGRIFTPKMGNILGGISRGVALRLAQEVGIETIETDLYVYDLYNADEIFITGTSHTISPVSKFNERVLEKPIPGPVTKQLQSAFSKWVGFDIVQRVTNYVGSQR